MVSAWRSNRPPRTSYATAPPSSPPLVFKHMDREMYFLSLRSNEKQVDKVRRFKTWIISAVTG